MEKLPLIDTQAVTSSGEAVPVVANVQIQKQDSVCSNTADENSAECYVGNVTHLRSRAVSLNDF